jgi:hypothetical protein
MFLAPSSTLTGYLSGGGGGLDGSLVGGDAMLAEIVGTIVNS